MNNKERFLSLLKVLNKDLVEKEESISLAPTNKLPQKGQGLEALYDRFEICLIMSRFKIRIVSTQQQQVSQQYKKLSR